uniref:Reverse transcriptase domain-containing protein n=1 Tax=Leptobrachium leishanense TaxID=445787 RepID=A0A8C5MI47_9ANUR
MTAPGGFTPRPLRLLTYNAKGLNVPEKRSRLLREASALRASVLFLQETHFRLGSAPVFRDFRFPLGYFSDYQGGKSRGVAILFSRDVPFVLIDMLTDPEGRFLFIKGTIADSCYTFASIYLPNHAQHRCLASIFHQLQSFKDGTLVVAGDFNTPLDAKLDTSVGHSSIPPNVIRQVRRTLDELRLVDVWRAFHTGERDYTFFSPVHGTHSRLDYIFLQYHRVDLVEMSSIEAQTWSDHAPVTATLSSPLFRPTERQWRLNLSLLTDPTFVTEMDSHLQAYFETNGDSDTPEPTVWEAHKAVARGLFISKATALKRLRSKYLQQLIVDIRTLELRHQTSTLPSDYQDLLAKRRELNDSLNTDIKFAAQKARCSFALKENKPGRLLAQILRRRQNASYIAKIRSQDGTVRVLPESILLEFQRYYQGLYDLDRDPIAIPTPTTIQDYLRDKLPQLLSETSAETLDAPIGAGEIQAVLKSLKNYKCPGPDGLPAEYYRAFSPTLIPRLLALFSAVRTGTPLHPHTLSATISVLLKPNKDASDPRSYRPISLLNTDLKILAKVMANRLTPLLPSLIHPDQVGFVPGREARDATTRALGAIGVAKRAGEGLLLLSTDAEKAFDRVQWDFMFLVLRGLGVGPFFLQYLKALYDEPTARVRVNGALSPPIVVRNGTRQGCPLSPLLFALTLEPLLVAIRNHPEITGIRGHASEHRLSAYADDLLFFLTDIDTSLPAVMSVLEAYGLVAGLKINHDKSEFLGVCLEPAALESIRTSYPFRHCPTSLRYLGTWLATSTNRLLDLNFNGMLRTFHSDLSEWTSKYVSWLGRVAVLKMNLLPRLLYLFHTLPIAIPSSFFLMLRKEFLSFVWPKGRPRVGMAVLCRPKTRGGLALPDMKRYYTACHLLRIIDWSASNSDKRWLDLERTLSAYPLWAVPWFPPVAPQGAPSDPNPVAVTLRLWHKCKSTHGLSTALSPLLPLSHNPKLQAGVLPSLCIRLAGSRRLRALDFPPDDDVGNPLCFREGDPPSPLERFNYLQLRTYLRDLNHSYNLHRPLTPFERLCHLGLALNHGVSTLYGLLQASDTTDRSLHLNAFVIWVLHLIMGYLPYMAYFRRLIRPTPLFTSRWELISAA